MTTITTKRHPLKFYASVAFMTLFFCSVGTLLLFASVNILQKKSFAIKDYSMPLLSLVTYLLAFSMLYTYWKNSPKIILNKHSIKIGSELFNLKDIKDIALTGKMPFKFIFTFPMEGTAILFNNGTEKILFDDMYSNISEIKLFLEQVVLKKQDLNISSTKEINKDAIGFKTEETFRGNQFSSLRGISLWGVIGFFIFLLFSKLDNLPIRLLIFVVVFGTFWVILHSWLMHYFGLTKDHLIVRNHNFIWKVRIHPLTDIKEVVYETQGKLPNCMRIITNDFRNKLYPAGTLRDKTWLDLKNELEARGVTVRNECI
ncbi:hypothetical protein NAL32_19895 [Chryseobacterium sp. Ch-15]|uniref:Uncharacterized protein n=1 Tax=Chryseobacterium muglaense TaxID=2893752 RepID=A0A9Q3UU24_9FLAO|nr:hypothetical protein [Chryseobacterium muglaense]MBD3906935.1 hypothetical protein [Chryseobacterium muglaense]MCC9033735.1 hypothetical protein [Chryseobacterium muglaense]MCM2556659.1 hypothetical protein [Chryseobacterium muglaense]